MSHFFFNLAITAGIVTLLWFCTGLISKFMGQDWPPHSDRYAPKLETWNDLSYVTSLVYFLLLESYDVLKFPFSRLIWAISGVTLLVLLVYTWERVLKRRKKIA